MIRHIIWDAGGTLFDTYPAMVRALVTAMQSEGLPADEHEIARLLRVSRQYAFATLSQRYALDATYLESSYRAVYAKIDAAIQPVFPGALEVIQFIKRRGGYNFIITHRSREGVRRLLDAHGLQDLFVAVISSDDAFPRKPDPASIQSIMQTYDLVPNEVLVVGDRPIDIWAGRNAGVCTCLYATVPGDEGADVTVAQYADLLTLLKQGMVAC